MLLYEYNREEIRNSLKEIKYCDIIEFYQKFIKTLYAKIFFIGNLSAEQS
jgi:hypothetical protein